MTPPNKIAAVAEELKEQTDRGAAIIAVALLDELLAKAIVGRLLVPNRTKKALFGAYKPLSTFSAKIDLAFALGLIHENAHRDLTLMREIRNEFAHSIDPVHFNDERIAKKCKRLLLEEKALAAIGPKDKYVMCFFFHAVPLISYQGRDVRIRSVRVSASALKNISIATKAMVARRKTLLKQIERLKLQKK